MILSLPYGRGGLVDLAYTRLCRHLAVFMRSQAGGELSVLEFTRGELQARVLMGNKEGSVRKFDARPEK